MARVDRSTADGGLQEKVSAALAALPRGEPSPPGEPFRRTVLAAMPDLEAMELVDRFFEEVGAEVVGTHASTIALRRRYTVR